MRSLDLSRVLTVDTRRAQGDGDDPFTGASAAVAGEAITVSCRGRRGKPSLSFVPRGPPAAANCCSTLIKSGRKGSGIMRMRSAEATVAGQGRSSSHALLPFGRAAELTARPALEGGGPEEGGGSRRWRLRVCGGGAAARGPERGMWVLSSRRKLSRCSCSSLSRSPPPPGGMIRAAGLPLPCPFSNQQPGR